MKSIEHWKQKGFEFEARFPDEYDLWINLDTMQKLRRYFNGREWLTSLTTGEYEPVCDPITQCASHTNTKARSDYGNPQ